MTPVHRQSIVVAEDNPGDRLLIQKAMEDCRVGTDVSFVEDGRQLIDHLRRSIASHTTPSLVLLDLNMPRMDGREVLRIVKHDLALRRIPIVVLTNSTHVDDISGAYDEGANTFFQKPMDYAGLTGLIDLLTTYWLHGAQLPSEA